MCINSPFINDLRGRWNNMFGSGAPFTYWAIGGERDEFVPTESSLDPFPIQCRAVIPGNHLDIVRPVSTDHLGYQLLLKTLVGQSAPAGPWNSARVAIEDRRFRKAISQLEPNKDALDDDALVDLALALEGVGRRNDALALLEGRGTRNTDAMGALAGRLKRRWWQERREVDAQKAYSLYSNAFALSKRQSNYSQAYYHGINMAFMEFAHKRRKDKAEELCKEVLQFCKIAAQDFWRYATEGEAFLYLGNNRKSLLNYRKAVQMSPSPRQLEAMFSQASWILTILGNKEVLTGLARIFKNSD